MSREHADDAHEGASSALLLAARLLMAGQFLVFGTLKFRNSDTMYRYIESFGLPGELVWPAAVFQLVAGTMLVLGYRTRLAAAALAAFCLIATMLFHFQPGDLNEIAFFLKDLTAAGGFLLLTLLGPGRYSVDGAADR